MILQKISNDKFFKVMPIIKNLKIRFLQKYLLTDQTLAITILKNLFISECAKTIIRLKKNTKLFYK